MIRLIALTSILAVWATILHAQVQLPDLYSYHYTMSRRDPFISADAPKTIMDEHQEPRGIVSGDIVSRYLENIVHLIKNQLYVGGISIGTRRLKVSLSSTVSISMSEIRSRWMPLARISRASNSWLRHMGSH